MTQSAQKRLVVLVSGGGSNLQSIIDACAQQSINAKISAVISNNPDAGGLERAAKVNIPNIALDHRSFDSREAFDQALRELIDSFTPDLVILAGFMRILTPEFVDHYVGKMLNIHPSLLPAYPGLNTHKRAIQAGEKEAGATVHFVTPELDGGPAIIQARVSISTSDNEASLAAKVLEYEHQIYPKAIEWFCEDRLQMRSGQAELDNLPLANHGIIYKKIERSN
jgi:phosphoribosylglycinamide formyltransferase-1